MAKKQSRMELLNPYTSRTVPGGVGGLLAITDASQDSHFCAYDGNGNVTALVKADGSGLSAQYEYGPFGELLRATGPMAKANPFRFSTKYQDDETDLIYYGYRYYSPSTGRWPNRDPLQEAGGINLYGFAQNNPVDYVDTDGRGIFKFPPISIPWPKPSPIEIPWPPTIPDFPLPRHLPPTIPFRIIPPSLPRLSSLIPRCVKDCAGYVTAGKDAKATFDNLVKNYTCICDGKQVSMGDYDGCEINNPSVNWSVATPNLGLLCKEKGRSTGLRAWRKCRLGIR